MKNLFCLVIALLLSTASEAAQREPCGPVLKVLNEFYLAGKFLAGNRYQAANDSKTSALIETARYYRNLPWNWGHQAYHLAKGLATVADMIKFNPLPGNLIAKDHPWITGKKPGSDDYIWPDNIIFSTPSKFKEVSDEKILRLVGKFLMGMAAQSTATPEIPLGPKRRMPHAINYIHGSSHYNSGILIFNDFQEGLQYLSNPEFRAEIQRFEREEKREVLLFFRNREYTVQEMSLFVVFVRSVFHWFANSDGPKKTALWGNPSPYPVVNIITGHWATDVYAIQDPNRSMEVVREPLNGKFYFKNGPYPPVRNAGYRLSERLLALATYYRIKARGRKGSHSTLDRRIVDKPGSTAYRIGSIYKD